MSLKIVGPRRCARVALVCANYVDTPIEFEDCASVPEEYWGSFENPDVVLVSSKGIIQGLPAVVRAIARMQPDFEGRTWADMAQVDMWTEFASNQLYGPTLIYKDAESRLLALTNAGVRFSEFQMQINSEIMNCETDRVLEAVEAALATRTFIVGHRISLADVVLSCAILPLFRYTLQPKEQAQYPNTNRWLRTCIAQPQALSVYGDAVRFNGEKRIGGQIDILADPVRAQAVAIAATELNKGYKKKETQRQAEKAAKEDATPKPAAAAAAPAAAVAAAAAPAAAAAAAVPETAAVPGVSEGDLEGLEPKLFSELTRLGINTTTHRHEALVTVEEMIAGTGHLPGLHSKNLFLRAKVNKKLTEYWLVTVRHDRDVNLGKLTETLGYSKKTSLRLATNEVLEEKLGVKQGSVSPFALLSDSKLEVKFALDAVFSKAGAEELGNFHPLLNTASTSIKLTDLLKFIASTQHPVVELDLDAE